MEYQKHILILIGWQYAVHIRKKVKVEMTSAEVKAQIKAELEKSREANKTMLREVWGKFYKRIFKKKGKTKN